MRTFTTELRAVIFGASLAGAALGCSAGASRGVPGLPTTTVITRVSVLPTIPVPVTEPSAVVSEVPVRAEVGAPTGIAIEPESGRRLVLGFDGRVTDLETGELVWQPLPGAASAPFGFTDLVALSVDQLAVTAQSDGFLVDLRAASMAPHFCYEPEGWEEVPNEPIQVSGCLALDRVGARFYAQPRTIENAGYGTVTGSFLAAYDAGGGADIAWWALPDASFVATGMVALPSATGATERLILASGAELFAFDIAAAELAPAADLGPLGVESIAGLALDARAQTLLLLDDARLVVTEVRVSALELE